jgi:hypothetical protein
MCNQTAINHQITNVLHETTSFSNVIFPAKNHKITPALNGSKLTIAFNGRRQLAA